MLNVALRSARLSIGPGSRTVVTRKQEVNVKPLMKRRTVVAVLLLPWMADLQAQVDTSAAEGFPTKPIRWIVPFPAGGPTDLVARLVGHRLAERLQQPVVIEHRAGALGTTGLQAAARAAPDGHTIVLGLTAMVLNAALNKLEFDPMTELAPISQLTKVNLVLLASTNFPARSVQQVLDTAKTAPGTVTCGYGSAFPQLGCELLRARGRAPINTIPYKGNGPAMNDLIGGQIHLLFDSINTALPQVHAQRVRAIAITDTIRGKGPLGDLPTVAETLPGFELRGWFGVLAPAHTPRPIILRLNREIAAVLDEDEVRKKLIDSGFEIAHGSPEDFDAVIRRDHARYSQMIREAGIKPE
jgi:tripartite-type tricarboxylate transporter receptor subunit TctC